MGIASFVKGTQACFFCFLFWLWQCTVRACPALFGMRRCPDCVGAALPWLMPHVLSACFLQISQERR